MQPESKETGCFENQGTMQDFNGFLVETAESPNIGGNALMEHGGEME